MEPVNNYDSFDPESYLGKYYFPDHEFHTFLYTNLNGYFKTGMLNGKTMMELGAGPVPVVSMYAAEHYDEIYLSDVSTPNIEFLSSWRKTEKTDLLRPIYQNIAKTRADGSTAETIETTLNGKIKSIMTDDLLQQNPNKPAQLPLFDLVGSLFCVEEVISDKRPLRDVLQNISNLLKPGGYFIQIASDASFYDVDDKTYRMNVQRNTLNDRIRAFEETGFQILRWSATYIPTPQDIEGIVDANNLFAFLVKKK